MASPTGRLSDAPWRLWPVRALARGRHLGLGRGSVPPCLGARGGGGPGLPPPELGGLAGRPLQLIHPPPGRRNDRGAEEQDATEPQETADSDERTSAHQESPVELNASLGCLIGHAVTPLSRAGGRLAVLDQLLGRFCPRRGRRTSSRWGDPIGDQEEYIGTVDSILRATNYVLGAVLFAVVLFFGGIRTRLERPRARSAILGIGSAVLLGTVAWIATFTISVSI
jgi:hypothetical protein